MEICVLICIRGHLIKGRFVFDIWRSDRIQKHVVYYSIQSLWFSPNLSVCFSVGKLYQVSLSRSSAVGPLGLPGVSINAKNVQRNHVSTDVFLKCCASTLFVDTVCVCTEFISEFVTFDQLPG